MSGTRSDPCQRATLQAALEATHNARTTLAGVDAALEETLEERFKETFNDPLSAAEHRREHRRGRPAKLAADPELRAFVEARFATMTFDQIADAVANTFPPERRVARSSIHRWWKKHHKPANHIHL